MMFGDIPEHIRKRHEKDVPSLGSLDDIVLPSAPVRYVEAEIITSTAPREAVLDSSAKLDSLTHKAMLTIEEIVDGKRRGDDPKEVGLELDAAKTVLTVQLRVDNSRLKKRSEDTLGALLERMEVEDLRLMKTIG